MKTLVKILFVVLLLITVKGDSKTSLDWDLKNHVNIPVAGGVYLIHVMVPNIGERTLKWYGVMKPKDLNGF